VIPPPLFILTNHLWQSTLFAGLTLLLTLAIRKNRASARYILWMAASVKFLLPFSLLISLGAQFHWGGTPATANAALPIVLQETTQPFVVATPPPLLARVPEAPNRIVEALVLLWLCGFSAVMYHWTSAWMTIRAAVRRSSRLAVTLSIPSMSPNIHATETALEPCVFGLVHPVVLVPATMKDRLAANEWTAVLAHEVAHIKRRDNLTATVHLLVEAIFWFYPPVWWIGKRLLDERERACDEVVLQELGNPEAYASGILNVCEFYVESSLPTWPGVSGSNLRRRIEEIMANRAIQPLNRPKKVLLLAAGLMAIAIPISAGMFGATARTRTQNTVPAPFEVASIKLNKSNQRTSVNGIPSSGRLVITAAPVKFVIQGAYGVQPFEIINVDSPVLNERVDIEAKTERPVGSVMEMQQMLQPLLADRFKLAVHREMREMNALVLVLARNDGKLGPKMKKSQAQCDGLGTAVTRFIVAPPTPTGERPKPNDVPPCGFAPSGAGRIVGTGMDIASVIGTLAPSQRMSIVDQTGLEGRYDIDVTYTPEPFSAASLAQRGGTPPPGVNVDPNGPSLFTALEEQLGLKLQAKKMPVPVLVIDHIEPLTEN
jgi:bla regulator protein BlaR1